MATADVVTVRLEAETAGYLRDIKQADTQFTSAMSHINSQAPRAAGAMNGLSGQVGNVAAQFQDIGVQLAGGQSPLLIALQQGTQLTSVLQTTANPARALGAAFASLVSPVSLVTIATIALGGAALQYFGSILGDGRDGTEVIKEQNEAIRATAERWGEAVPALKAYVDELDRAAQAGEEQTAREGFAAAQFRAADEQLRPLMERLAGLKQLLRDAGAENRQITELSTAFEELDRKINDQTATAEDAERVAQALAAFVGGPGANAVATFGQSFAGLTGLVSAAASALANFNAQASAAAGGSTPDAGDTYRDAQAAQFQFVREQERINGLTAEQLALEQEVTRVKAEYARANKGLVLDDRAALTIAQERLAAEERRRQITADIKTGGAAADASEKERQAVLDLIDALMFEQSLLGMTSAEKAVQNALRKAGAAATDEERAAIEELITATYAQQDAIRAAEQAQRAFENIAQSSLTSFIQDLRAGKSAAEALSNVFDNIANQLIQMAVQGLVRAAFGGIFGGGGGNPLAFLFGGARAHGGSVQQGKGYMVGERGPEPFFPTTSGRIISNDALRGEGGGGGGRVEVVVSLDGEVLNAEIVQTSGKVVAAGITRYDSQLQNTMAEKTLRYGGA